MLRGLKFVAIALATLLVVEPAIAQYQTNNRAPFLLRKLAPPLIRPNLSNLPDVLIRPSQAAAIAQAEVPDSKVIKVRLLPRGDYAVTLVANGNVTKVFVNGQDGSVY
ncbi:MAG: PepSY domain-containing protein [Aestuariivirga sp.]